MIHSDKSITAIAHPNIAFIKYWGKVQNDPKRVNWGLNPSLSMTLSKAKTTTTICQNSDNRTAVFLNGSALDGHGLNKVVRHCELIFKQFDISQPSDLLITSENNFPTAAGIASSASGFCALTTACLGSILGKNEANLWIQKNSRKFSEMCRWGSGSACRSPLGPFMLWEDEAAKTVSYDGELYDTIVIFSKKEKATSSSDGHISASSSPLMEARQKSLPERLGEMLALMQTMKDSSEAFQNFGALLEIEALEMHNVTRHSSSPVEYWSPETELFINALQAQIERKYFFTIDAGPNIHLISQSPIREEINSLLEQNHISAEIWEDRINHGPECTRCL